MKSSLSRAAVWVAMALCCLSFLSSGPALGAPGDLDFNFVAGIGRGITPDSYPTFDSGTGAVNAVALQSDGKILAGGNLSKYDNSGSLNPFKRLNPDGSLDTTFNSGGSGFATTVGQPEVNAIVVLDDDSILVGGVFDSYNGVARGGILKLNADGSLDSSFAPSGLSGNSRFITKIRVLDNGQILVGGGFTVINGNARQNMARLNADGSLDTSFNASALNLSRVSDMLVAPDGKIYVSGAAGNSNVTGMRRIFPNGQIDQSFVADLGKGSAIDAMLLLPSGSVLAGGFTHFGDKNYNAFLIALTPTGQLDATFNSAMGSGPNGYAGYELLEAPDGKILVASRFSEFDGQSRVAITRLNSNGSIDNSFAPLPYTGNSTTTNDFLTHFYCAAYQPDGKIVAGGWFDRVTDPNLETYNLTRFEGDPVSGPGSIRWTTTSAQTGEGESITLTATRFGGLDGAVSVNYASSNGSAASGSDYTAVSGSFNWAAGTGGSKSVTLTTLQDPTQEGNEDLSVTLSGPTGGPTIAAGEGTVTVDILDDDSAPTFLIQPVDATGIATLTAGFSGAAQHPLPITYEWFKVGGLSPIAFGPTLEFTNLQASAAGEYFLRATITDPNTGQPSATNSATAELVVVEPPGSIDPTWNPGAGFNSTVTEIFHLDDGSTLVGGSFSSYSGTSQSSLVKLSPAGVLDPDWPLSGTGPNSSVTQITPATGGQLWITGTFSSYNGVNQRGLARINADGTLDTGFVRTTSGSGLTVLGLADGTVLGGFDGLGLRKFDASGTELASFQPYGTRTAIYGIKELPDGKLIVAAQRTNNPRTGTIFRLNADLTTDPTFNPATVGNATAYIYSIDIDDQGRIYVGGSFANVNGISRANLARLNPDGSVDDSYAPNIGGSVNELLLQDDGRVILGGFFFTIDGISRPRFGRVLDDGSIDEGFFPGTGFNSVINAISRSPQGEIYVGGSFSSFSGNSAGRIVRLNGDFGSLQFDQESLVINEQDGTATLKVKRLVGSRGAVSVEYRLGSGNAQAGIDYTGTTSGTLTWAEGDLSDRDLVFTILNNGSSDGTRTLQLELFDALYPAELGAITTSTITILDDESTPTIISPPSAVTTPEANPATFSVSVQSATAVSYQWLKDGNPIPGATDASYTIESVDLSSAGEYSVAVSNAAGTTPSPAATLTVLISPTAVAADWTPSGPGAASLDGTVRAVLPLPDGGALIGGDFTTPQRGLVRIDAAGQIDSSFTLALDAGTGSIGVHDIAQDGQGRIYIAGRWDSIDGSAYPNLVRLKADGTLDDDFATVLGAGPDDLVRTVSIDRLGGILIGGSFEKVANLPGTSGFARISEIGEVDRTLVAFSSGDIYCIQRAPDSDKIYLGGAINNYFSGNYFFRINANGTRDFNFNSSGLNGIVRDVVVREDGSVLIGGDFTSGRAYLNAYSNTGTADTSFLTTTTIDGPVNSLDLQSDGTLVIGGAFTTFGEAANRFARVTADNRVDETLNLLGGFDDEVLEVAVRPDGRIWVAGQFAQYQGATANRLTRLQGNDVPTAILTQPSDQFVETAQSTSFTVTTVGQETPTFQWFKDGDELSDNATITGSNSATLQLTNVQAANEGIYSVRVTAGGFSEMSRGAELRLVSGYEFGTLASSGEYPVGRRFVLFTEGSNASSLSYQWMLDSSPVPGADSAAFAIESPDTSDSGVYTLEVNNGVTTFTSDPITLTFVDPAPAAIRAIPLSSFGGNGSTVCSIPDGRFFMGFGSNSLRLLDELGNETVIPAFNGRVNQVLRQANGGYLVVGQFTQVGGQNAKWLARLKPDFTLDTDFQQELGSINGSGGFAGLNAVAELPDRRIAIAGSFTDINGLSGTSSVAILHPDGAVDTSFASLSSNSSSSIRVLAYQPTSNSLLIGGGGALYGGANQQLHRIALNGSLDGSFDPEIGGSGTVEVVHMLPDGKILIGGTFTSVKGVNRSSLARLTEDGNLDTNFTAVSGIKSGNGVGRIADIGVEPDGDLVLVGDFQIINGIAHNNIVRLRPDGTLDTRFNAGFGLTENGQRAEAVDIAADGSILVTGSINEFDGTIIRDLVILEGDRIPLAFSARPADTMVASGDELVLRAGGVGTSTVSYQWFKGANALSNGGRISGATSETLTITAAQASDAGDYRVVISNLSGNLESTATVTYFDAPEVIVEPSGGTFFVGNDLTLYTRSFGAGVLSYQWTKNGDPLSDGARLSGSDGPVLTLTNLEVADSGDYQLTVTNTSGSDSTLVIPVTVVVDPSGFIPGLPLTAGTTGQIRSIWPTADGGAYLAGSFFSAGPNGNDTSRSNVAKLGPDGVADPNFAPNPNSQVNVIAEHLSDGVLIGGVFSSISGVAKSFFARVGTDGSYDFTFMNEVGAGPNSGVNDIIVQPDGKILIGGAFQSFDNVPRVGLARLNSDGSLDTSFVTPLSNFNNVNNIALLPDGKVIVVGSFTISGRQNIIRLDASGALDSSFNCQINFAPTAVAIQPDGKILVGGFLSQVNGQATGALVRLEADGALDTSFAAGADFPSQVTEIAVQSNGSIVVGGNFNAYGGSGRSLVRLLSNGSVDPSFDTGTGWASFGRTEALAITNNGNVWVGGSTNQFNNQTVNYLVVFNGDAPVAPPAGPNFGSWVTDNLLPTGMDGPNDDADFDGIANLLEYALGLDPLSPDGNSLPKAVENGGQLTYTYQRLRSDITYVVETTSTLNGWTTTGVDQGTPSGDGTTTASIPIGSTPGFLQLKVTLNPN